MLEFFAENPVAAVIVGCEIGLWVLLGLGMVLRYLVGLRRTSTAVLATPLPPHLFGLVV